MNKLKIAVLDNGVDEKLLASCGLPDIIQQNKGNISDEEDLFLHGTNCAMIIGLNCADAELYSYKLLDNTGKGNVDDLKSAFDWCLMNNIRLVNLSFGTTHEYSRWFYISRPVIWKSLFISAFCAYRIIISVETLVKTATHRRCGKVLTNIPTEMDKSSSTK